MKTYSALFLIFPLLTGSTLPAFAGPLQSSDVAAEAKWVAHLDVEKLKGTHLGAFLGTEILDKKLAQPVEQLRRAFNFELDWRRIRSITVFGTELKRKPEAHAVLIVRSDLDVRTVVETVTSGLAVAGTPDDKGFRRISNVTNEMELYALGDKGFGALLPGNTLVLGQSKEAVEQAAQVLLGRHPSLATTRKLAGLPDRPDEFLAVSLIDPMELAKSLPPQAAGLRTVSAARLVLTEDADQLGARLALRTGSEAAAVQIQQILQGLVSLLVLSMPDNKDVKELTQAAHVTAQGSVTMVGLQMSVDRVTTELKNRLAGEKKHH